MALRQACIISDQVTTVTPARGLAPYIGVSVTATPSVAPPVFELLADGITWVPLYPLPIKTLTDANGVWSIALPSQSYTDPNTVTWVITLPDNSQWGGPVTDAMVTASLVSPLTIHTLATAWGWGRVATSTAPAPVIVTGPVGPAGPAGVVGPNPAYGTLAARPTASSQVDKTVYVATDQNGGTVYQVEQVAGVPTWVQVAAAPTDPRLSGTYPATPVTVSGTFTVLPTHRWLRVTAAPVTLAFPPAASFASGQPIAVKLLNAGAGATVTFSGNDTVDGVSGPLTTGGGNSAFTLVSDGLSDWSLV